MRPESNLAVIAEAAYEAKKAELKNDGINARWFSPLQLHVLPKLGSVSVEEYDALRKLAQKLGIAIIVVHHCKKTTDISSAPLEKVIGSVGITGTAETILVMEQLTGTQDCKLTVTGKDVEQTEKHLAWNGHGFDISDDVREAKLGATQKLVLDLIRENPRCTQKYIVDTIGKDQGQVAKAINRLIELCLIVKKGVQLSAQ